MVKKRICSLCTRSDLQIFSLCVLIKAPMSFCWCNSQWSSSTDDHLQADYQLGWTVGTDLLCHFPFGLLSEGSIRQSSNFSRLSRLSMKIGPRLPSSGQIILDFNHYILVKKCSILLPTASLLQPAGLGSFALVALLSACSDQFFLILFTHVLLRRSMG